MSISDTPVSQLAGGSATMQLRHYVLVLAPIIFGFSASVLWSQDYRQAGLQQIESRAQGDADVVLDSVLASFQGAENTLLSMAALYAASEQVNFREFKIFAEASLDQVAPFVTLGWVPRVTDEQRAAHEAYVRSQGLDNFMITEAVLTGTSSRIIPRKTAEEYFPVSFLAPVNGNEAAIGYDLASEPVRLATINKVRKSRARAATPPIKLVQDADVVYAFLLMTPLYPEGHGGPQADLLGMINGVFRWEPLVENAVGPTSNRKIRVDVQDLDADMEDNYVYRESTPRMLSSDFVVRCDVVMAQRTWRISTYLPGLGRERAQNIAVRPLLLGLAISLLLSSLLLSMVTRAKTVELSVLQRTEELRISNHDLSQFAYVASHDLRSPLRAIDNLSTWIADDLEEHLTDETRKHVDMMKVRVRRMENLLDSLLAYSQVGRRRLAISDVDVRQIVEENAEYVLSDTGISVELKGDFPTLATSKTALNQVFANLISNAAKHHDRETGLIEVWGEEGPDFWEFFVADDGPGIPPEYRDKVFEMFQTLQSRDVKEGSGMGLALVRRQVETFGGAIALEGRQPRGTLFRFTWPKRPPKRMVADA